MLPTSVDEDRDWDLWEERLLSCDQEELVQFLLSRMCNDRQFMQLVAARFGQEEAEQQPGVYDLVIANYCQEIDTELEEMIPDVDYLISFTERFFLEIVKMDTLADQMKAYATVILKLDDALAHNAGSFHEEYELLVDEMKDAQKKMVQALKNAEDKNAAAQAVSVLVQMAASYKPVTVNYIQAAIDDFAMM